VRLIMSSRAPEIGFPPSSTNRPVMTARRGLDVRSVGRRVRVQRTARRAESDAPAPLAGPRPETIVTARLTTVVALPAPSSTWTLRLWAPSGSWEESNV
jgi:hypothetical protein